jgi:hypothetical protein
MSVHTVTVRASDEQHSLWISTMSLLAQRNVAAFLRYAGDFTARYYQEEHLQKTLKDPILNRVIEKKYLRALLDAASASLLFIPRETISPIRGPLPIKKNLKEAIHAVKEFLSRNGEDYR